MVEGFNILYHGVGRHFEEYLVNTEQMAELVGQAVYHAAEDLVWADVVVDRDTGADAEAV